VVNDPDGYVRRAAVEALAEGWLEEPSTLLLLCRRAHQEPDEELRQEIEDVLERLGVNSDDK